jgi:hypothetical protein
MLHDRSAYVQFIANHTCHYFYPDREGERLPFVQWEELFSQDFPDKVPFGVTASSGKVLYVPTNGIERGFADHILKKYEIESFHPELGVFFFNKDLYMKSDPRKFDDIKIVSALEIVSRAYHDFGAMQKGEMQRLISTYIPER